MEVLRPYNPGILEIYTGPMKCGKTARVARRLNKLNYHEDVDFIAFKPNIDTRSKEIESRDGSVIPCISVPVNISKEIFDYIGSNHKVVVFSESQFFDKSLTNIVENLLRNKRNVIIEGLNLDFRGEPFGNMPYFLSRADYVEVLTAVCDCMVNNENGKLVHCKNPASRTQRLINGMPASYHSPLILIGDKTIDGEPTQSYESRCLEHHIVPDHPAIER